MNEEDYLKQHHHITESAIGLISIQTDMEGVNRVVAKTQQELKAILLIRIHSICEETGMDFKLTRSMFNL